MCWWHFQLVKPEGHRVKLAFFVLIFKKADRCAWKKRRHKYSWNIVWLWRRLCQHGWSAEFHVRLKQTEWMPCTRLTPVGQPWAAGSEQWEDKKTRVTTLNSVRQISTGILFKLYLKKKVLNLASFTISFIFFKGWLFFFLSLSLFFPHLHWRKLHSMKKLSHILKGGENHAATRWLQKAERTQGWEMLGEHPRATHHRVMMSETVHFTMLKDEQKREWIDHCIIWDLEGVTVQDKRWLCVVKMVNDILINTDTDSNRWTAVHRLFWHTITLELFFHLSPDIIYMIPNVCTYCVFWRTNNKILLFFSSVCFVLFFVGFFFSSGKHQSNVPIFTRQNHTDIQEVYIHI